MKTLAQEVIDLTPKQEEVPKAQFDALGKAYTEFLAQMKKTIPHSKYTTRLKTLQNDIEQAGNEFMDLAGETDEA